MARCQNEGGKANTKFCTRATSCEMQSNLRATRKFKFASKMKFASCSQTHKLTNSQLTNLQIWDTLLGSRPVVSLSLIELKNELVKVIHRLLKQMLLDEKPPSLIITKVTGYTKAIITSSCNERSTFYYAHPCFQGEEWYDWAMIHFEEINDLVNQLKHIIHHYCMVLL